MTDRPSTLVLSFYEANNAAVVSWAPSIIKGLNKLFFEGAPSLLMDLISLTLHFVNMLIILLILRSMSQSKQHRYIEKQYHLFIPSSKAYALSAASDGIGRDGSGCVA